MFQRFLFDAGGEGAARERFQLLVTDLVSIQHETANEVALPSGSDWGIDTYAGRLNGQTLVWQSKFFEQWTGPSQQNQVRESFKEVQKKANAEGFTVSGWTLCIPCTLPPGEQKWFDGWRKRQEKATGTIIKLWTGATMRTKLMQVDAQHLRDIYFPESNDIDQPTEPVSIYDGSEDFSKALFIMQLEAAGRHENDAAKGLFFAAEALVRDVVSRGDTARQDALDSLHLDIHTLWEDHFNRLAPYATHDGFMQGLIDSVMSGTADTPDPDGIRLRPAHRKGVAHRVVEDGRAGWVSHWRKVMEEQRFNGVPKGPELSGAEL